jgi:hypothetical protein
MIVDEAHALGRMPALYAALTEGRKFGLKLVLGTQNKNQFQEHYGHSADTMLAASVLKIVFRCNEPNSARWVSELVGEDEREKPRTGVTASVSDQGRDSINYSSNIERRPVVCREEIMALPKLQGFWKYQDMVVRFRFEARNWPASAERFIPREVMRAASGVGSAPVSEEPAPQEESAAVPSLPQSSGHANLTQKSGFKTETNFEGREAVAQPEAAIEPKRQWRFIRVAEDHEMASAPAPINRADREKRHSAATGGELEV